MTTILDDSFFYCISLEEISLPKKVTCICDNAFKFCSALKSINIPDNVTSIGNDCFFYCTSLASINIPISLTSFGGEILKYCRSLVTVNISGYGKMKDFSNSSPWNSVKSQIKQVNIRHGVTSIGNSAFSNC